MNAKPNAVPRFGKSELRMDSDKHGFSRRWNMSSVKRPLIVNPLFHQKLNFPLSLKSGTVTA